jgi:polar amino acid transport system ATP-binding protein
MSIIQMKGVKKRYGALEVLRGVDLEVPAGQTLCIIGSSGSGKSTLLRLLMTLERPDAGEIHIAGEPLWTMQRNGRTVAAGARHLRHMRAKVGMVFQHFNLFPHMSVLRNMTEAPTHVLGIDAADAEARAIELLRKVGLQDKARVYPAQLSGGQRQRVAIARALAMRPEIMLFDEITSALDPELIGEVLHLLQDLSREGSITMLIVTHHMRFAQRSADRVLFLDGGVILEDGPPDQVFGAPREERTRHFLAAVLEE